MNIMNIMNFNFIEYKIEIKILNTNYSIKYKIQNGK